MKQSVYILVALLILTAAAAAALFIAAPERVLEITEAKTGEILWQEPIEEEEWFHHEYIHSVQKSKVIEKFKLGSDGQMYTMESWTRSFGAGLPYEDKGNMEVIDGWYVTRDIYSPLDELQMIPSHLYPHTFHFNEKEADLTEPPFKRTHIKIEVRLLTIRERIGYFFT
ncbi:hypothetical protein CR205_16075 [Alteribacter lacisalsi]|jgi:hypothetical protein|uniref:DUF1850 domain-containing protein n=1 Tax=Alteribacter lacisalsi TaxID=2045244 RepID=A0A2W0HF06_9BACI|nr:DUF1850 domain-containing protein [Alteribacter lacisalsi]PYZ95895.1 hypothetical protein CR205_16075 [Alteribacter lacisalsi]